MTGSLASSSEDPDDRVIRMAHGFADDDDPLDPSKVCEDCGISYDEIASHKIRECSGTADPEEATRV